MLGAWKPIASTTPQYEDSDGIPYSGAVLKAYTAGTSTNILIATDSTGGTTVTSVALNSNGFPEVSGTIIIPYIDETYKLSLYPTQTAADSDTGAIWTIDNISIGTSLGSTTVTITGSTSLTQATHCNAQINATGTITLTLPVIAVVTNDCIFMVRNAGSGVITLDGSGSEQINGGLTVTLAPGVGTTVIAGSTDWASITDKAAQVDGDNTFSGTNVHSGTNTFSSTVNITGNMDFDNPPTGAVIPQQHLYGIVLSNDTDTAHDINVTAGQAVESTNNEYLVLSSEQTKQIDVSWATGDDAGGLSSSLTVANDTWYHIFIVDIGGTVETIIDTSVVCANGIADHTVLTYRRIGSVLTDGSANIIGFLQVGNRILWDVPVQDITTTNPGTNAATATLTVPTGLQVFADMAFSLEDNSPSADTFVLITSLDQADTAAASTNFTIYIDSGQETAFAVKNVITNISAQIRYRLSASTADHHVKIHTDGWTDPTL